MVGTNKMQQITTNRLNMDLSPFRLFGYFSYLCPQKMLLRFLPKNNLTSQWLSQGFGLPVLDRDYAVDLPLSKNGFWDLLS